MTTQTSTRTRMVSQETRPVVTKVEVCTQRPTQANAPKITAQTQSEKEAERWIAQMMFDHYNG